MRAVPAFLQVATSFSREHASRIGATAGASGFAPASQKERDTKMTNSVARGKDPLIRKLRLLDESDIEPLLVELRERSLPTTLGFLNQHGYNIAQAQPLVNESFLRLDYLLRDGIGIKMACWINGLEPRANLNGSDFIPRLVEDFIAKLPQDYELFAMGTREPWLTEGASRLFAGRTFHAIDGFQSADDYLRFFRERHQPGRYPIIVLAMGMPKQEQVAAYLQEAMDGPALLICGGAILDFAAERFPRAPLLFRRCGLEWAFRLSVEPRRLFKRYAIGIPLFFYYLSRNVNRKDLRLGDFSERERSS